MRQLGAGWVGFEFGEGMCHAFKPQLVKLFDGRVGQQF